MPAWKVLLVLFLGITCLGLALSTIVVPVTLSDEEYRWAWMAGLLVATIIMGTVFILFLRKEDRTFKR